MSRRTLYLPALIVAAGLMVCAAAVLAASKEAEATFPGKNGNIAYTRLDGTDFEIYTIPPTGGRQRASPTTGRTILVPLIRLTALRSPSSVTGTATRRST
jgi:hypothetical protein